jgi:single-stranded-DNA-specific exonuclease
MATGARKRNGGWRRWKINPVDPLLVRRVESEREMSPLLARTLAARGLTTPQEVRRFLDARLADNLGDPFGLKDMDRAADRVAEAVRRQERIAIFGDYDVDGITATVLLLHLFRWLGADPFYYIPHRVDEGYGLSCEAIDFLADKGARLLITVDNGISSVAEVDYAASRGLDCVVTDHHQAGAELPRARAVVNPNRGDCS